MITFRFFKLTSALPRRKVAADPRLSWISVSSLPTDPSRESHNQQYRITARVETLLHVFCEALLKQPKQNTT